MSGARLGVDLPDETCTAALAALIAAALPAGSELHLVGPLGAGKTAFARGFLRALGHRGPVKSPTFTLVESYDVTRDGVALTIHHFDLYRLADADELDFIGFDDYHRPDAVLLIEWPSRAPGRLAPALVVELEITGPTSRHATLIAHADAQWSGLDFGTLSTRINELGKL
ncbi:MAG: tRNA (adenosine(37)-N6)-threonylcarbamoyltransferase complex ATPase subunit type 1 TsaE [Gammaproteobacteria bacterium]|nr:tRNA (adenosine(37)-N6)-threonylcarbamoyltransferase complex ATPase subunit type 1 TsaE [Gammaproteobacteria bacterium]